VSDSVGELSPRVEESREHRQMELQLSSVSDIGIFNES